MEVSSSHQITVFFLYVLSGMVCGAFFDVQRFLRGLLHAGRMRTYIEDFIFSLFCILTVIGIGFLFNNGELRYYQFMGLVSGVLFYAVALSRFFNGLLGVAFAVLNKIVLKPALKMICLLMIPIRAFLHNIKTLNKKVIRMIKRFSRHRKKRKKNLKKRMKML